MNEPLSSPDEKYREHIKRALDAFDKIFPHFRGSLSRLFGGNDIEEPMRDMIKFHDLGKLTRRWQKNIQKESGRRVIMHAPIGAAYLCKTLKTVEDRDIKNAICFAICIHHIDKGLVGDNIERPDVRAIIDEVVDEFSGEVIWDEGTNTLGELFPEAARELTVDDLRTMARELRNWSRGCGILEQHRRRMLASAAHHILKLCDFLAASKRKKAENDEEWKNSEFVKSMDRYLSKYREETQ